MQLDTYLQRIQYQGPLAVDQQTLCALHRAHLLAIPYENLDIHLGRTLSLDIAQTYTKIVEQQRGGWCYEMNGLFAWALREIGFTVTMLGSTVGAPAQGDGSDLDHLILRVDLAEPWLIDVGFGNGILDPLPLRAGMYRQGLAEFQLAEDGNKWYFHNHPDRGPGYGFTLLPHAYASFAPRCHELQTSPDSGFVRTTVCHKFMSDGFASLRGAMLKKYGADSVRQEEIASASRYRVVLEATFGLAGDLADTLWPGVQERHQQWKAQTGDHYAR